MLSSKVTSKYQATIPRDVREFLNLKKGDKVAFQIKSKKDQVIIKRLDSSEEEYLKAVSDTLLEWSSLEDDEAYDSL
jgi:antitoxin PrlF